MYAVGLTGGIGSGKSLVASIFTHLGIPVFNADSESKVIMAKDSQIREQLEEWFGNNIYVDNKLDRAKLAGIIFNNPEMLAKVNNLIHPMVMDRFISWGMENQGKPYLIHEAAILFESGLYKHFDVTILVTASERIRKERVMKRDKSDETSVNLRMQNQWPDERKSVLASYIIVNEGDDLLIPRIIDIHNKLIGNTLLK